MFKALNKKIVGLTYFILILTVSIIYGSIVLHSLSDDNVTILVDNKFENSIEEIVHDSEINDTDYNNIFTLLIVDFPQYSPLYAALNTPCFFVTSYSNIRLQQLSPPP